MTKPQFPMHDYHMHKSLKHVVIGCGLALTSAFTCYLLHNVPRIARYNDFYSNYDPMASFNRMMAGGYLDSCPAPSKDAAKDKKK